MSRLNYKLRFIVIVFLANFTTTVLADCHFIRLTGYQLSQRPDVFFWGELSPLIALEAGRFYHLSPKAMESTGMDSGNVKGLQGELYYIPQHLIDENMQFSLRLMVLERDKENADDIILPLREHPISLAAEFFTVNQHRVSVFFRPFGDRIAPRNEQSYQFEILRQAGDCSHKTSEGRANDRRYRLENDLKRLQNRIKFFHQPSLIGGREYRFYQIATIEQHNFTKALHIAGLVASVNTEELLLLGLELETLHEVKNFNGVWKEYQQLVQRLFRESFTVKYVKEGVWKKTKVPSLGFHPKWKKLTGSTLGLQPPEKWQIPLAE